MNEQELFRLIDLYASAYMNIEEAYRDSIPYKSTIDRLETKLAKAKEAIIGYIKFNG